MIDSSTCEACGLELESSEHVFWGCEKAQEIWTISGNSFETPGVNFPKFKDLIWQLKFEQRVKNDILELIIMVSWAIWFNYNEVRKGKARQIGQAILQKA